MTSNKPIYVTKPRVPDKEQFKKYIGEIWESANLTNFGPLHQLLEQKLSGYLNVETISLFSNGTMALICALKMLKLEGEVIATPYSFVATSQALRWNNLTPVFADIDPNTFNICPKSIISRITSKASAILAVHCYGILRC